MTKAQTQKIKKLMPVLKAVRLRCLDCSAFSSYEVKKCHLVNCALYPYRFGTTNHSQKSSCKKSQTQQNNNSTGRVEVKNGDT